MALVFKDRVKVTSTTTGTGTLTLGSAVSGFQNFSVIGNGNTTYYTITDASGNWEVGIGTYTSSGTTLSRDTILESSTGGSAIDFPAGTKTVFVTYPAEKAVYLDASGNLTNNITGTSTGISGSQTANYVYASPNGSSGNAAFRALVANDIPSLSYLSLSGGNLTGGLKEAKTAIAASDIDLSLGNYFTKTITATTTFTVSNVPSSGTAASFILDLTNAGSQTINWSTSFGTSVIKWAGGSAPTLTSSGRDSLGFYTYDGGSIWTALVLGKDIK